MIHHLLGDPRRPVPATAGIGLRFPHLTDFETHRPNVGLVELHTENLFTLPSPLRQRLERLRTDYPFSLHGVGLSLGSADGLDTHHLARVATEANRYQPMLISEHLCWNRLGGVSLPDLLPLPMTEEALKIVVANIDQAQNILQRPLAIENLSAYAHWQSDTLSEGEFLSELVHRTGCKLLVDINNLYVNQLNFEEDPQDFLAAIPPSAVAEIHLAGPSKVADGWIDTHATPVPEAVWALYETAVERFGAVPTIVEWDQDLPPLSELVAQAERATRVLISRTAGATL